MKALFPFFLVFLEMCVYLSNDAYVPSMTIIQKELATTSSNVQATLSIWFLGAGLLSLLLGPLSDYFGRRPVLLVGCVVFILSTVVCALAPNIDILFIARLFQGMSVSFVIIAGYGTIHTMLHGVRAVQILSVLASITVIAPALGPLVGALIIEVASWRAIFWTLVTLGSVATIGLIYTAPDVHTKIVHSLKQIVHGYKLLLINKNFVLFNIIFGCVLSVFFVWIAASPFIIMRDHNVNSLRFGMLQALVCGFFILGNQITKYTISRYSVLSVVKVGLFGLGLGVVTLALFSYISPTNLYLALSSMIIAALSASTIFAPLGRLSIEASGEPIGRKMAMGSTIISATGSLTTSLAAALGMTHLGLLSLFLLVLVVFILLLYMNLDAQAFKFKS